MDQEVTAPIAGLILLLLVAAILAWWRITARLVNGPGLLVPYEPRRVVPWLAADVTLVFGVYVVLQVSFGSVGGKIFAGASGADPEVIEPTRILASSLANVLTGCIAVAWLRWMARAGWVDMGFTPLRPMYDLRLGVVGFAATAVPVYAVQALATHFAESHHPILELLKAHRQPAMLAVSAVAAIAVAPLVEELLFRVVLQGYFEKLWPRRSIAPERAAESILEDESSVAAQGVESDLTPDPSGVRAGPILASSAIFALLHAANGPDPIALFILAMVLGYLYQRTHRLWPSVVVHALLNTCSLALLWLQPEG